MITINVNPVAFSLGPVFRTLVWLDVCGGHYGRFVGGMALC